MTMTYGQVREFIRAQAGDDCAQSTALELFMVNALSSIHSLLGDEEKTKFVSLTLSPSSPKWTPPVGLDKVVNIVDDQGCAVAAAAQPCLRCTAGQVHPGRPTSYRMEEGVYVFHPAPDKSYTFRAEAMSSLDVTLYDTDAAGVVNWRAVNLPETLHTIYAKWVLGLVLMDVDAARSQNWLSIAEQEMGQWKQRLMSGQEFHWGRRPMSSRSYGNTESLHTIMNPRY